MGATADEEPPHDAYEQVTDPGRYQVLHEEALKQIEQLVTSSAVNRFEGVDLDSRASSAWPDSVATRLEPVGDGAAICFTFTPFPGVILQFGHGGHRTFPACGCDVCDDDPLEEAERMAEVVADVVAGRFTETRYHRRLTTDIYESVMHSGQGSTVRGKGPIGTDVDPLMPVGTTQWARWTLLPSPAAPT